MNIQAAKLATAIVASVIGFFLALAGYIWFLNYIGDTYGATAVMITLGCTVGIILLTSLWCYAYDRECAEQDRKEFNKP